MKRNVQKEEEIKEEAAEVLTTEAAPSELIKLLALWDELKALGINSISDLEVRIARLNIK